MEIIALEKVPTFDHIIHNIYLADFVSATNKDCLKNIDIIINISNSRYKEEPNIIYHHFDIDDNRNVQISEILDKFMEIINMYPTKNILIHCMNSVSRSVTLMLYYLLLQGYNLKDAIIYLKSKRSQYTRPNYGYYKQLLLKEKELYGSNSISFNEFINSAKS